MSSDSLLDAGTYAWVVIIAFFLVFAALQIRNCLRNVRGNSENSFTDVCPDQPSTSTRQGSSVYTIDIGDGRMTSNYANPGYSITESGHKSSQPNDGLPSYDEAIGKTAPCSPAAPAAVTVAETIASGPIQPTVAVSEISENDRGQRHRRHRRHRHRNTEDSEQQPTEDRRRHGRRGFRLRRHLAKMARNQSNQQ